jgi:Undecaprenyl-phosphate glucose phosphotransferase
MSYVKREDGIAESLRLANSAPPSRRSNWTISYQAVAPLAMAGDVLIIVLTCFLSVAVYHLVVIGKLVDFGRFMGFAAVVAALFIPIGQSNNLYSPSELLNLKAQTRRIAINWFGVLLFLTAIAFMMKIGQDFSRGATITFAFVGLAGLISERVAWRILLADGMAIRRFSSRKVALIAENGSAAKSGILEALSRHGMQPIYHFELPADSNAAQRREDVISEAIASVRGSEIEEIIVSVDVDHWPEIHSLLSRLRILPLPVNLVPVGPTAELFALPSHTIGDTITIELQHGPRALSERAVKRAIDFMIAASALLLLLPFLLVIAIAIKSDSSGPIIFRQRRSGFNGRQFNIFKFRTMSVQEDGDTIIQAKPKDSRITRVGTWLRRTSIDELPQLFNVLRGEMSIVGPRPHALAHDTQYDELLRSYAYRQHVKPGLTGWAQVHGYRGRTQTVHDMRQRVKFDLWYINNWSLALDFRILLMTVTEIARGRNAY